MSVPGGSPDLILGTADPDPCVESRSDLPPEGDAQIVVLTSQASSWNFGVSTSQDADGDGVNDDTDNCPSVVNFDQADLDHDGIGDLCDSENSVAIEIRPDSDKAVIPTASRGRLPVAIYGSGSVSVSDIVQNTVTAGIDGKLAPLRIVETDVNEDGFDDLLLFFDTAQVLSEDAAELCVSAVLTNGVSIIGCDTFVEP